MSPEPLTADEIAKLERSDEEWLLTASGFDAVTVRRLLAALRRYQRLSAAWRRLARARAKQFRALPIHIRDRAYVGREDVLKALDELRGLGIDPDSPDPT